MLVPEHIAPILAAAGIGTLGQDLFCYHLPAAVSRGLMVTGDLSGTDIDHELPGWRMGRVQVIVRDPAHASGLVRSRRVIEALTLGSLDLPAVAGAPALRLRRLRAIHDPIIYPRSQGDEIEFSMNFEAIWVVIG